MGEDNYNYKYDPIGNREWNQLNGSTNTYVANQLNQYTAARVAGSARNPSHDLDGNLTWDGIHWSHGWDAENRLSSSSNLISGVLYEYAYDYQSRRISKTTLTPNPYSPLTTKYIWDGWNIAAEIIIDHVTPATNISYYTWGLDLSGTLQGAGGVGGLLSDTKVTNSETNTYFAVGDANGNITEYVDVSGATAAHGEHNAFGGTKFSGSMKDGFTHWFSSKPFDAETRLVQYQLRPYSPELGIFMPRDPSGIKGEYKENGFVNNNPIDKWDYLGLWSLTFKGEWVSSEIKAVEDSFNTLKSRMPIYLSSWRTWASAASKLPDKCVYKKAVQQELTIIYRILSMVQDGLNSSQSMYVNKKDYGDKANAAVGMPWSCWPYNLGNTFNGNLYLNSGGSNPLGNWCSSDMNVTIFHELSHVANVLQESGSDGLWSNYAHNVEYIAKYASELVLSPMVNWNIAKYGNKCCPPSKEWMPVKR